MSARKRKPNEDYRNYKLALGEEDRIIALVLSGRYANLKQRLLRRLNILRGPIAQ